MKKLLVLAVMMTTLITLSACKKSNESDDPASSIETAVEVIAGEEVTFDFDEVVENDADELSSSAQTSAATPAPGTDPASVEEMVVETTPESEPETTPEPEAAAPVVKSFSMTAKQWEFVPSTITVNKGDTVRLSITSTDVTHGFSLRQFGVSGNLEPGKTVQVEFVADKKGTFTFLCNVLCGSGHSGMKGSLVVK